MFCVDCVPFGFLDIQFSGVFTFQCTRSHVYDAFYLHDLLLLSMLCVGNNLTFFVRLLCKISLFFRLSVAVWALFALPYCLL